MNWEGKMNDSIKSKITKDAVQSILKRACHLTDFEIMGLVGNDYGNSHFVKLLIIQVLCINFDKYSIFRFRDTEVKSMIENETPTRLSDYDLKLIKIQSRYKNLKDGILSSFTPHYRYIRPSECEITAFLKDFDEFMDYHDKIFNTKVITQDDLREKEIINSK